MVITPKQTYIAYRCPVCGQGVNCAVGVFSLTGDRMRLKCPCGGSFLNIDKAREGKYTITAPCAMCGNEHKFTLAQDSFFKKDLFKYPCTYTGIDACFIGVEEKVEAALDENEKEVVELYKSMGIENPEDMLPHKNPEPEDDEDSVEDVDVLDTIIFVLRDLLETDSIKCKCDSQELDYTLCNGYVKVFCKNCEASADIPALGRHDADDFLECYELELK